MLSNCRVRAGTGEPGTRSRGTGDTLPPQRPFLFKDLHTEFGRVNLIPTHTSMYQIHAAKLDL